MRVLHENGLAPYHTFGINVTAEKIIEAQNIADFTAIWRDDAYIDTPKLVIGQGSNLLFCRDYQGIVILNRIKGITVEETDDCFLLHVGAGEDWHQLVCWTLEHGMHGLENLALIPGCVGSAPIQNIGAYGVELKDTCDYVDVLNVHSGDVVRYSAEQCQFGYRDSIFKHQMKDGYIIVAVGFKLSKQWQPHIGYGSLDKFNQKTVTPQQVFDEVCAVRKAKLPDPKLLGNAGSFFKNPVVSAACRDVLLKDNPSMPNYFVDSEHYKLAAGWLIDQCNLKGYSIGGAKVHEQQALVLTNAGNATATDVLTLAKFVVDSVIQKFDIELEHEVRFMAETGETKLAEIL